MEQRRTQRYQLHLPLRILKVEDSHVDRLEQTRDISSGGVCFLTDDAVEVGGRMEYVVTLSDTSPPVQIHCLGKVVRNRQSTVKGRFEVAVTMERYQFVRAEERAEALAAGA